MTSEYALYHSDFSEDFQAAITPDVSFIVPVYNHGAALVSQVKEMIRIFEKVLPNFQLIVVDDGSIDSSFDTISRMNDRRLVSLGYKNNLGKGGALLYGLDFAKSDIVTFVDGDLQAFPVDFQEFLSGVRTHDIVIASKWVPGSKVSTSLSRKMLSIGFNLLVRNLLDLPVSDTQAGFKVFKRKVLTQLAPLICVKRYAFDAELLVVAKLLKLNVLELPARVQLSSSFKVSNVIRMLIDLLGIAYRLRVKRWYHRNISNSEPHYKPIIRW